MDILDDMGVSKLSAKVFFKKWTTPLRTQENPIHDYELKQYAKEKMFNRFWLESNEVNA